jgi:hypothetical protein
MKLTTWAVMGSLLFVLTLGLAIAVFTVTPVAQAAVPKAAVGHHCTVHYGKGLADAAVPNNHQRRDFLVTARMGWVI